MLTKNYFTFPFYVPRIFGLCVNWHEYLFNYLSRGNHPAEYRMRNGIRLVDDMGELAGTMAVVFVRREYGPVEHCRTIVDIGAHLGTFAAYASQCSPDALIYCYEPERRNFDLLKHNIVLNRLKGRVHAFHCAVAASEGTRDLAVGSSLSNSFHVIPEPVSHQAVRCTTLKEILEGHRLDSVDMLKMNCEGAEYEILESCPDAELKRIRNIRLEYHNLRAPERTGESLSRFLIEKGYRIERFTRYLNSSGFIWAARLIILALVPDALDILDIAS